MNRAFAFSLLLTTGLLVYGAWYLLGGDSPPAPRETDWLWTSRTSLFATLPPSDGGDVFLGASLVQYGAWGELLGDATILNRGIAGDTTVGVLARLPQSVPADEAARPGRVFLMVGLNDLMHGAAPAEVAARLAEIVEALHAQSPGTQVVWMSLLPVRRTGKAGEALRARIVETNALVEERAAGDAGLSSVDLHTPFADTTGQLRAELTYDGVHLNGDGYALWRDVLAAAGLFPEARHR